MLAAEPRELVERAMAVRKQAYAPYSKFQVGAALLTANGSIFSGCNVENASFGLTCCAERAAVFAAVAAGHRDFAAIAVATPGAVAPCGACRQVLAEFNSSLRVLLLDSDSGSIASETTIAELLPGLFRLPEVP